MRRFQVRPWLSIGWRIGHVTCHMLHEHVFSYLGVDAVRQILPGAIDVGGRQSECQVRDRPELQDVAAWWYGCYRGSPLSVITHLIDEEVFEYFAEAKRVLVDLHGILKPTSRSNTQYIAAETSIGGGVPSLNRSSTTMATALRLPFRESSKASRRSQQCPGWFSRPAAPAIAAS
jgi:hypothetical protein